MFGIKELKAIVNFMRDRVDCLEISVVNFYSKVSETDKSHAHLMMELNNLTAHAADMTEKLQRADSRIHDMMQKIETMEYQFKTNETLNISKLPLMVQEIHEDTSRCS